MAVTILHPLTDDVVGPSFDVLVAYDFTAFREGTVRVTCTLSDSPATPAYYDVNPATNAIGELTFAFGGLTAPHDYALRVATDPASNGTAAEDPIHTVDGGVVPVQIGTIIAQNMGTEAKKGGAAAAKAPVTYRLTGRCRGAGGNAVKVRARGAKASGKGPVIAGPEVADMNGDEWRVLIDVPDDGQPYVVFEAKLAGNKVNKGRKR